MDGNGLGTCINKTLQMLFRLDDHQMHVNRQIGGIPASSDDFRSKGNVWNKTSIHHIDVDLICPGLLGFAHLRAQLFQVS